MTERERWRQNEERDLDERVLKLLELIPHAPVEVCLSIAKGEVDILEGLLFGIPGGHQPRGILYGRSPIQVVLNTKPLLES